MPLPDFLNYKRQMEEHFDTVTTIKEITNNIFNAYPVRVRTQQPLTYYEIGARNINENGELLLLGEDTPQENANIAAFEAQVLQAGDIVIPYRNKKLHVGFYKGSDIPMVPNPSLLIIRSGSLVTGKYLLICLQQPFIIGYLEYLSQDTGKLKIENVSNLLIPATDRNLEKRLEKLDKIIAMQIQQERMLQNFKLYKEMISVQFLREKEVYARAKLHTLSELLDETETLIQTLKNTVHMDDTISILSNNVKR